MRAAVVVDGRGFGGAQVYARSLVRHAPASVRCDVVTTAEHAPHLAEAVAAGGGRIVVVPTSIGADAAPAVRAALADLRPDLVQLNLVDPTSMLAAVEAAADVAPAVATLHMRGAVPGVLRPRLLAATARLRAVVAVSEEFAAVARDDLGVPGERVVHVVNGVDPLPVVDPPDGPVPVVGALGRLTSQKGFDVLLEAVRLLVRRGVGLEVLLGGEGRERPALEAAAVGLPVRLLGFQDGPERLLRQCDVFCVPSRVEALPLVLVEAVSAGLPAVSSDVGDVRRALGDVVRLVPPDDPTALAEALQPLLLDRGLRRDLGARGAATARASLTAQRMAQQAWEVFLPAAAPPSAPASG